MAALARFLRDRRGVAAIEAALVLPLLLLFIAGIFEYSRVLLAQHTIRDLVDETARTAVVTGLSDSAVMLTLEEHLLTMPVVESYSISAVTASDLLTVTVQCDFDLFFGELLPSSVIDFTISVQYPV